MWTLTCKHKEVFPLGFGAKKDRGRGFSVLTEREMKREQNNERGGGGGKKCLQTNSSISKTCIPQRMQCPIGSASRTILTCVDQRFILRGHVWYVYSGGQDLPSNARAFCLTSFETQSSSCDYIRTSDRLIYSPVSPGSE